MKWCQNRHSNTLETFILFVFSHSLFIYPVTLSVCPFFSFILSFYHIHSLSLSLFSRYHFSLPSFLSISHSVPLTFIILSPFLTLSLMHYFLVFLSFCMNDTSFPCQRLPFPAYCGSSHFSNSD